MMAALNVIDALEIRAARKGDGQALYDVTQASVQELAKDYYRSDQIDSWMDGRNAETYEKIIRENSTYVAIFDKRIVGFVDSIPGEITRLFIRPEFTGYGLGRKLVQLGIEMAQTDDNRAIIVEATLNAESFYSHFGFQKQELSEFSHGSEAQHLEVVKMMRVSKPNGTLK